MKHQRKTHQRTLFGGHLGLFLPNFGQKRILMEKGFCENQKNTEGWTQMDKRTDSSYFIGPSIG